MKNALLIPFLLLTFSAFGQYLDYFGMDQKWMVYSSCEEGIPECQLKTDRIYFVDGDTDMVATGELYWIIREQGRSIYALEDTLIPSFCEGEFVFNNLAALLRQEGRKIYRYNFNDETDELLYDFSLMEGDTLPVTWLQIYGDVKITEVDSFMVSGQWVRTYETNSTEIDFIIEGVGHERGFLEPMYSTSDGCIYDHRCYWANDYIQWSNDIPLPGLTCNEAVSIEQDLAAQPQILVFPNPANQTVYLKGELPEQHELFIYDQVGRLVFQTVDSHGEVDISDLQSGLYQLVVNSKNGVQNVTFLKK